MKLRKHGLLAGPRRLQIQAAGDLQDWADLHSQGTTKVRNDQQLLLKLPFLIFFKQTYKHALGDHLELV